MQVSNKARNISDSFRSLMAAVISRALSDLEDRRKVSKAGPQIKDETMAWINGPDCESYCLELDIDYPALREKAIKLYQKFLITDPQFLRRGRPRKTRKSRQKAPETSGA
jgi:hypothetical protein